MERRAKLRRLRPKKLSRKRCKNDGKLFDVTKPNREFCCDNCRKEFHANGGNAFGPLKTRLEKLVRQITNQHEGKLGVLEVMVHNLRDTVSQLQRESDPAQSPNPPSQEPLTNTRHHRGW